jgi:hydroxyacylglutathione hydrolase
VHLPLPELPARIAAGLPDGEIWVHCAGGYRASIAASLLAAAGRDVVAVEDSFEPAAELARLPVIRN